MTGECLGLVSFRVGPPQALCASWNFLISSAGMRPRSDTGPVAARPIPDGLVLCFVAARADLVVHRGRAVLATGAAGGGSMNSASTLRRPSALLCGKVDGVVDAVEREADGLVRLAAVEVVNEWTMVLEATGTPFPRCSKCSVNVIIRAAEWYRLRSAELSACRIDKRYVFPVGASEVTRNPRVELTEIVPSSRGEELGRNVRFCPDLVWRRAKPGPRTGPSQATCDHG